MNTNNYKQLTEIIERLTGPTNNFAAKCSEYRLYYKNNPDGTLRWVWPAITGKPLFLKFYNTATLRAQCIAIAIRIVFFLRLQKFFASGKITLPVSVNDRKHIATKLGNNWALFSGTQGINQTALLYAEEKKLFYKIPLGSNAGNAIASEISNLCYINTLNLKNIKTPYHCIESKELLQLEDVSLLGKRSAKLTNMHWAALKELADVAASYKKLHETFFWQETKMQINTLKGSTDKRIPKGLVRKLDLLLRSVDENIHIPFSYAHGDFTPWNMYVSENKLVLYDFEMGKNKMPILFDVFHFVHQQQALATNNGIRNLFAQIDESLNNPEAKQLVNEYGVDVKIHHKLYLLYTIGHFLNQYTLQTNWQLQIHKSIHSWSQAVNIVLEKKSRVSQRQLLLNDFFDYLMPKKYAALKWFDANPEYLDTHSDVDICVDKGHINEIRQFVKSHPLVTKVEEKRKSFMIQLYITLADGSYLCIDCIWNFKRKSVVMLSAKKLLENTLENCAGVIIPAIEHDFYYTWLFYTLNNAEVPEKYKEYYIRFGNVLNDKLAIAFPHLGNFRTLLSYTRQTATIAQQEVISVSKNKGINKVLNSLLYATDTLREVFFKRGFMVTFSGVDGAGKSTVIENLKGELEKKYRRKVVVLRHRPALLPMLSAWTDGGRAAAEQKAANTLPRQGDNTNVISSLLRFGYYYIDFLFGQFYIYAKYVFTGHIVLYDRYYFDFINDSRRSNIALPSSFIRLGYLFLIKPKFNFFLYANENIIRKRKQELDINTIKKLTNKYLNLFSVLSKKSSSTIYMSIENVRLNTTMNIIDNQIKTAVI